ncbi:hypothetical protein PFISCL1PPCAC_17943, partial [Pristionchus fissidentatus]
MIPLMYSWGEKPSILSWLLFIPILLSAILAAGGIFAKRGDLVIPMAAVMLLYAPLLLHALYRLQKLQVVDIRILIIAAAGTLLLVFHCIFVLFAAKNEIDSEVNEVFSLRNSMEF